VIKELNNRSKKDQIILTGNNVVAQYNARKYKVVFELFFISIFFPALIACGTMRIVNEMGSISVSGEVFKVGLTLSLPTAILSTVLTLFFGLFFTNRERSHASYPENQEGSSDNKALSFTEEESTSAILANLLQNLGLCFIVAYAIFYGILLGLALSAEIDNVNPQSLTIRFLVTWMLFSIALSITSALKESSVIDSLKLKSKETGLSEEIAGQFKDSSRKIETGARTKLLEFLGTIRTKVKLLLFAVRDKLVSFLAPKSLGRRYLTYSTVVYLVLIIWPIKWRQSFEPLWDKVDPNLTLVFYMVLYGALSFNIQFASTVASRWFILEFREKEPGWIMRGPRKFSLTRATLGNGTSASFMFWYFRFIGFSLGLSCLISFVSNSANIVSVQDKHLTTNKCPSDVCFYVLFAILTIFVIYVPRLLTLSISLSDTANDRNGESSPKFPWYARFIWSESLLVLNSRRASIFSNSHKSSIVDSSETLPQCREDKSTRHTHTPGF
jgi:hypothetical protein